MEHGTNVSEYCAALVKGASEASLPQPEYLKTLEQTKRELASAAEAAIQGFLKLDPPVEANLFEPLATHPELFFSPKLVRANRCFIKGLVPKERILKEFGSDAVAFFSDMTTDPKLNPHPKPEEIALAFRNDFEVQLQANPGVLADKREALSALFQRVQRSKAPTDEGRAQRNAFQTLSFLTELLHFYEHQNTESPDVLFAQRLPALVEQLVLPTGQSKLDEKLIEQVEHLMAFVINPDHRQMVVNNIGKAGGLPKTLKFVLRLRAEKVLDLDNVLAEFIRHILPKPPERTPEPQALAPVLRLLSPEMQRLVVKSIMRSERIRKQDAEELGKALVAELGLKGVVEEVKANEGLTPEIERQLAWAKVKDLIARRTEPTTVAAAIRDRLNAKYDAEEIRQSWLTLTETEPMSLIRIFCQIPYLANGKTDSIARTVMETYVTRLTHEKYAATYHKIVNSLRNMFHAKPDSPTLLTFMALVRWVDPAAAAKLAADIGMPVHA
jgi:hypothetical protein